LICVAKDFRWCYELFPTYYSETDLKNYPFSIGHGIKVEFLSSVEMSDEIGLLRWSVLVGSLTG